MKKQLFNTDPKLETTLKQFNPDFNPGFETRLMDKIASLDTSSYNQIFNHAFQRISLTGIAAVVILLIAIFASDGSISTDTLIGTSNINIENLTAMTLSGF